MITKHSVWLFAAMVGCTSNVLFETNPDSTVMWTPDNIELQRYPSTCGIANPPFNDQDLFGLSVYDARGPVGTPQTAIYISFMPTDVVNHDYPISLSPVGEVPNQQGGITADNTTSSTNGDVNFSYQQGQEASTPGALPLAEVIVRFDALPHANGDLLIALAEITFNDASILSFTARPTLPSVKFNSCGEP